MSLFNKFTRIPAGRVRTEIEELAKRVRAPTSTNRMRTHTSTCLGLTLLACGARLRRVTARVFLIRRKRRWCMFTSCPFVASPWGSSASR